MALTDEIKIIKSILNLYCKTGATLEDIAGKFYTFLIKLIQSKFNFLFAINMNR